MTVADKCPSPSSPLPKPKALARIAFFNNIKNNQILGKGHMGVNINNFSCNLSSLQDALKSFAVKNDKGVYKYDGVRFYFALSDAKASGEFTRNTLYLILVPTVVSELRGTDEKEIMSDDDESNAYIITNTGVLKHINLTDVVYITWMNRYTNKIIPRIENVFDKRYDIKFQETHSIWYDKSVLFNGDGSILNLLNNASCMIEELKVDFASWTTDEDDIKFTFKTDLLFEIKQRDKAGQIRTSYFTLAKFEIDKKIEELETDYANEKDKNSQQAKEIKKEIDEIKSGDYADTGLPCPPNKCP
jgi:hypothetical protein